jgi:hypothetical protein
VYAYASCHWQGFTDHVLAVIDVAEPTRPEVIGRWWLPGMHTAGGETPSWSGRRYALHHAIVSGNLGYAAWRDGGMTILDIADPTAPKLLAHRNWCPPFGGGTHTPLPLPGRNLAVFADEGNLDNCANGIQRCWVFDVREPTNPVQIAAFPTPAEEDYCKKGAKFGPHNLHENRPGSFQSEHVRLSTREWVFVQKCLLERKCSYLTEKGLFSCKARQSQQQVYRKACISPGIRTRKFRFAPDSPLEGTGFEPSVPL